MIDFAESENSKNNICRICKPLVLDAKCLLSIGDDSTESLTRCIKAFKQIYSDYATSKLLWETNKLGLLKLDGSLVLTDWFRLENQKGHFIENELRMVHFKTNEFILNLADLSSLDKDESSKNEFETLRLYMSRSDQALKTVTAFLGTRSWNQLRDLDESSLSSFFAQPPPFKSEVLNCVSSVLRKLGQFTLRTKLVSRKTALLNERLDWLSSVPRRISDEVVCELATKSGLSSLTLALAKYKGTNSPVEFGLQEKFTGKFELLSNEMEIVEVACALKAQVEKYGKSRTNRKT